MRLIAIICTAAVLLSSCQQNKKSLEQERLKSDSLQNLLIQKDSSLFVLVNTMTSIEENLEAIKVKENIISAIAIDNFETAVNKEEKITNDINAIYDLLEDNKRKVMELEKQLKKSRVNEKQLKNTIASLNQRILEKDAEILELQQKLSEMNIEIVGLNDRIETLQQIDAENKGIIEVKDQSLQTAYFVIGTAKELKEAGVLEDKLIKKDINKDFNKEYFTQINILTDTIINFSNRKVEILSVHPSGSYELVGEEIIESIKIKDPWNFWSASKYLVVVVK